MSEEDFRVHFPENRSLFSFYTLKKVLQVLFALAMVALFATVALRSCTRKGSAEMQAYLWTEEAIAAASQSDFQVYSIPAINEASVEATFTMSHIYYTEPIGQFQFLLSYNLNGLKALAEKYSMTETPKDGEDIFAFVLEDSEGNRYTEYEYVTDTQLVNGFYRLVFTGIPLTQNVLTGTIITDTATGEKTYVTARVPVEDFRLCVYYKGAVDFAGEKLDELTVYEYGFYKEEIEPEHPETPRTDIKTGLTTESPAAALPNEDGEVTKQED